jgi:hypothetical protein
MPKQKPNSEKMEALKTLFLPSLAGYKGTIVSIPLDHATAPDQIRDLAEQFVFLVGSGCKLAVDYDKRVYKVWVPDGFSTVGIQLMMHNYKYEIVQ